MYSIGKLARGAAVAFFVALLCLPSAPAARAEDLFSALFGIFKDKPPPTPEPQIQRYNYGGGQAYCVRSCDGRYFPVQGPDSESKARACDSFCPASETTLVFGSNIDYATTKSGKPYSELPNAFRFRKEMVAGCTCNGKDQIGLATIKIEDDPTLRRGDIVAGDEGLVVANRSADDRRRAVGFSPLPNSARARFDRLPVVARDSRPGSSPLPR